MVTCIVCSEPIRGNAGQYCQNCWAARAVIQRSAAAMMTLHGISKAHGICVDCGVRQATCRDHRHYSSPLKVEFVCGPCNTKRGQALDLHELIKAHRGLIAIEDKPDELEEPMLALLPNGHTLRTYLAQVERDLILGALKLNNHNRTRAAKTLGITFRALRYRMEVLELR